MTVVGNLAGKVAFVTGGSRGIGAAIARRLARDGAAVAFTYVNSSSQAADVKAFIEAQHGRALAIRADSTNPDALRSAVTETVAQFGRLDVLVNSAGIALTGPIGDYALEDFDRMVSTNVRPLFVATQAALPHMPAGGRIIAIGSTMADRTIFPGASVYAMTKAAIASLVRGMAIDLAARQITINTVQPGPTATDMSPANGPRADHLKGLIPLKRLGHEDEVAGLVAYIASPEAGFVTGAALTINGGMSA
jgi:3-oxoacyl-[acyl-carrier protein] reductase